MNVKISNLFNLQSDLISFQPDYILSMLDPDIERHRIPQFRSDQYVLQLFFYDDDDLDKQSIPVVEYLDEIIEYFKQVISRASHDEKILIHCHAGASRSTAAAYIFYMLLYGKGREEEAFEKMLSITNKPWPNKYLITLAEESLNRQGMCLAPLEAYQKQFPRRYDAYVRLNQRRGL